MDDYIRRRDAIDALERTEWYHQAPDKEMVHGANTWDHQAWYKEQDVYSAINSVPPARVEPVVYGHWVQARGAWFTPGGDPVWECSECGKGRHVYGVEHGTYGSDVADGQWVSCPNCGCVMKGEDDG